MRQIKEVLRQYNDLKLNKSSISRATNIPRTTVQDYISRFKASDLSWPLPPEIDNDKLNALLFPKKVKIQRINQPDWKEIHQQLKRKGVTLQILWEEYKRDNTTGYQYSRFAQLYRQWAKSLDVWMPQTHKAGDKVFVDYSGLTVPIWRTNLKEIQFKAEIFVAVLGASDLIFCVASKDQTLENWIDSHCRMFEYYEGVASLIVPDNLRSAVNKANRYEPLCNLTYDEMARHYGCAIMPARGYKPRDKSKAEKAVQTIQRRILAPMRDIQHISLEGLNKGIKENLEILNNQNFQKLNYSRRELFEKIERSALRPLPKSRYEMARWFGETVNGGYHVTIYSHYYSVPYHYTRKKVDIRVTEKTVECFYQESLIACHVRDDTPHGYSTIDLHRPEAHRQQALWKADKLKQWAFSIGPNTNNLISKLFLDNTRHLHQKERSALGILRLSHSYTEPRLEDACKKALAIGTVRYDSILSLLKRDSGEMSRKRTHSDKTYQTPHHENIRGAKYYH